MREQYENRHPDMGVVCWKSKGRIWAAASRNAKADFNSTSFQLKLGSWPNRELQAAYTEDPDSFEWSLEEALEYEDLTEDHSDDLTLMLLAYMDEHPDAMLMRPGRK